MHSLGLCCHPLLYPLIAFYIFITLLLVCYVSSLFGSQQNTIHPTSTLEIKESFKIIKKKTIFSKIRSRKWEGHRVVINLVSRKVHGHLRKILCWFLMCKSTALAIGGKFLLTPVSLYTI